LPKVNIDVYADHHGAPQKLGQVDDSLESIERQAGRTSEKMKAVGQTMTIVGVAIIAAFAGIIKKASDAQETQAKFGTVFQDTMTEANAAVIELSTSYGLSTLASQTMLSATGDLLTGLGLEGEAALELSLKTQRLSVDLASFTNYSEGASGASDALTKAMLGERESVKALGIVITEAMVKEKLLAAGKEKLTGQSLLQAKAEATIAIAMDQSRLAIGDYARTQGSLANMTRELQARTEDLVVELGTHFIPIATDLVKKVTEIANKMLEWMRANPELAAKIGKVVLAAGALLLVLGPTLIILPKLVAGIKMVRLALMKMTGGFGILVMAIVAAGIAINKLIDQYKSALDEEMDAMVKAAPVIDNYYLKREKLTQSGMVSVENWRMLVARFGKDYEGIMKAISTLPEYKHIKDHMDAMKKKQDETGKSTENLAKKYEIDLKAAIKKAAAEAKSWINYLKSVGIKTIKEKEDRIRLLGGYLEKLDQLYKDNKVSLVDYTTATTAAKNEIDMLSGVLQTKALPEMRDFSGTLGDIPKKLYEFEYGVDIGKQQLKAFAEQMGLTELEMRQSLYNIARDMMAMANITMPALVFSSAEAWPQIKGHTEKVESAWSDMSQRIKDRWTTALSDVLAGTSTLKEGLLAVWGTIKQQFFDMTAKMITEWTFSLIKNMVSSAASGGKKITETLGSSVAEMGKTAASVGTTIGGIIVSLAKAIATGAKILAGAAKDILIVGAVALALYAGFKAIQALFKGPSKQTDVTYWLKMIKDNTQIIADHIRIEWVKKSDKYIELLVDLCIKHDTIMGQLTNIRDIARFSLTKYNAMIKAIKAISIKTGRRKTPDVGAGGFGGGPGGLNVAPVVAEGGGDRGGGDSIYNITLKSDINFTIRDTLDPFSAQKIVRQDIMPAILAALDTNRFKRLLKQRLGV